MKIAKGCQKYHKKAAQSYDFFGFYLWAKDLGDISGPRMHFGVPYGNILVEINVKGASPEAVFEMLQQIQE